MAGEGGQMQPAGDGQQPGRGEAGELTDGLAGLVASVIGR